MAMSEFNNHLNLKRFIALKRVPFFEGWAHQFSQFCKLDSDNMVSDERLTAFFEPALKAMRTMAGGSSQGSRAALLLIFDPAMQQPFQGMDKGVRS